MKTIFLLGLLTFSLSSWSQAMDHLKQRERNYTFLEKYYQKLLNFAEEDELKSFCGTLEENLDSLTKILEDDNRLISALRSSSSEDFWEYATHLEENSSSPLFSYYSHKNLCENYQAGELRKSIQALVYHVMNVQYLKRTHAFWIEAYGNF